MVRSALQQRAHCWGIVASTSPWLQMLDYQLFCLLQRHHAVMPVERTLDAMMTSQPVPDCSISASFDAGRAAMTPKFIRAAFQNEGLMSLNRDRILDLYSCAFFDFFLDLTCFC